VNNLNKIHTHTTGALKLVSCTFSNNIANVSGTIWAPTGILDISGTSAFTSNAVLLGSGAAFYTTNQGIYTQNPTFI